jgi:hypothetical protein
MNRWMVLLPIILLLSACAATPGVTDATPVQPSPTAAPPSATPVPPTPTAAPPTATPEVLRNPGESLDDFGRRIIPPGTQLVHPVLEGEFGPGAENVVVLFSANVEKGPYTAWVLVPHNGGYGVPYVLPQPKLLSDYLKWEVQAVLFAPVDGRPGDELIIMSDGYSGEGPSPTRIHSTWVYGWSGTEFRQLSDVTEALGDAYPAQAVRDRLAALGYGPLAPFTPPAGEPRLGETVTLTATGFTEDSQTPAYTLSAEVPVLQGSDDPRVTRFNAAIASLIQQEVDAFKAGQQDIQPQPGLPGSSLDVSGVLVASPGALLAFEVQVTGYYAGAAHPYHYVRTFNYDLSAGRTLTLDELFQPGAAYLDALANYCKDELDRNGMLLFPEGADPAADNYRHWSLTADGLQITFNEYEVAPYAAGPQAVLVPYDALKDMLAWQP